MASIKSGYFLPNTHSIKAEDEDGIFLPDDSMSGEDLVLGSDESEFPGYSSRGYAVFNYGPDNVSKKRKFDAFNIILIMFIDASSMDIDAVTCHIT